MREAIITTQNEATLRSYGQDIDLYAANTPQQYGETHKPLRNWIDTSLDIIGPSGKVFEIGSAVPRDARYIESKGYDVTCSDAVPGFVENLRNLGQKAVQFNALSDELPGKFDMVLANAVVPHFTKEDFSVALQGIARGLNPDGIFSFSVKQGEGEEWIHEKGIPGRYTKYWQPKDLTGFLTENGYAPIFVRPNTLSSLGHLITHVIAQPTR